jgi:ribose transport system substrate-binding protein
VEKIKGATIMKKRLFLFGVLLLVAGIIFAGGSKEGTESARDEVVIAYVVKTMTNPYYHEVAVGAEEAAEKLGANLIFQGPARHGDTMAQVAIVENLLALKPDVLILIPDNYTALLPVLQQYNEAGIPIIIADTRIEEGFVKTETFVGYDDASATSMVAEYVADLLEGKGKVAILEGQRGSSTAEARLRGYVDKLQEYPEIEMVASLTAGWDREKALSVAQDIIQANPDINAIFASNDEMALGAIQAVKEAGKEDQIYVTGFDAIQAAKDSVASGDMLCTIDAVPSRMGSLSVELALKHLEGETLEKEYYYPIQLLTE